MFDSCQNDDFPCICMLCIYYLQNLFKITDLYKLDIFQCFPVACCTWQYGRENSNGNAWDIQGPSSEQAAVS